VIVVDDKVLSSFLFGNAIIGGWCHFVVVEHGFIWQHSVLNYAFFRSKGERTLSTITRCSKGVH
jgi:hypothetical protein